MIIINFLYFWPHFDINNNFITKILDNNNISYTVSTTYNNEENIPKFIFIGTFIRSNDQMLYIENIPANYIKILYLQKFWNMTIIRKNLKITYAAKFNPNPSIMPRSLWLNGEDGKKLIKSRMDSIGLSLAHY